jgi:zinc transport system substrate-binding protein
MKKTSIYLIVILLLSVYGGCKKTEDKAPTGALTVAVSVFPIYDIARNICGNRASVFYTIPVGADPHTFEPRPSIARDMQNTTLFIGITRDFDGWMERFLPPAAKRKYLMETPAPGKPQPNPHIWLSARKVKKIATSIGKYMSEIDPANSVYYRTNMNAYVEKLNALDKTIKELFRNKSNKFFIQWHEAWNYFAADYGLAIAGTVQREGSDRSSVRSIKEIIEKARRNHVTAIVVTLNSEKKTAQVMAGEIKGTIVELDGIGDPDSPDRSDCLKLLYYDAKTLADALQ